MLKVYIRVAIIFINLFLTLGIVGGIETDKINLTNGLILLVVFLFVGAAALFLPEIGRMKKCNKR